MMTKIKTVLVILTLCGIIFLSGVMIKYYSNKIVLDSISYDAKRNRISQTSTLIPASELIPEDESIKWAKRSVTFTFNTGVEEYIIGVNTNGYLKAKRIR